MDTLKKNKQFVLEYFNAISGVEKTDELIDQFMEDDELKQHIQFFDVNLRKLK